MTALLPFEFTSGHLYAIAATLTGHPEIDVSLGFVIVPEAGWTAANTFADYIRLKGSGAGAPCVVAAGRGSREVLVEGSFAFDEPVEVQIELDTREEPWTARFRVAGGQEYGVRLEESQRAQLLGVGLHVQVPPGYAPDQAPRVVEELRLSLAP